MHAKDGAIEMPPTFPMESSARVDAPTAPGHHEWAEARSLRGRLGPLICTGEARAGDLPSVTRGGGRKSLGVAGSSYALRRSGAGAGWVDRAIHARFVVLICDVHPALDGRFERAK